MSRINIDILHIDSPKDGMKWSCKLRSFSYAKKGNGWFTLASTVMVLSEHLPRPRIRTPYLPALSSKLLSIRPRRWFLMALRQLSLRIG